METITLFVSIVIIVFGVLQIILFFKLWGMTNDVRNIRKSNDKFAIKSAIIEFAIGNEEEAKEIAYRKFVLEVFDLYTKVQHSNIEATEYAEGFNDIERKYKAFFNNASTFIDFGKFSSINKAKNIFK